MTSVKSFYQHCLDRLGPTLLAKGTKLNVWDHSAYTAFLTARVPVLQQIRTDVLAGVLTVTTEKDKTDWKWIEEEYFDLHKELNRLNNYRNSPSEWCPTEPADIYWLPVAHREEASKKE